MSWHKDYSNAMSEQLAEVMEIFCAALYFFFSHVSWLGSACLKPSWIDLNIEVPHMQVSKPACTPVWEVILSPNFSFLGIPGVHLFWDEWPPPAQLRWGPLSDGGFAPSLWFWEHQHPGRLLLQNSAVVDRYRTIPFEGLQCCGKNDLKFWEFFFLV